MPRLIVTAVGTSLLTNQVENEEQRRLLFHHANDAEDALPPSIRTLLEALHAKASEHLANASEKGRRRASAELNALLRLLDEHPSAPQDLHWLIATDTGQGRITSGVLKAFLEDLGLRTQIHIPSRLSTADTDAFSEGVKNLLRWADETLPGYRESGYEIIFNLTGGFKSLQGVLNTVGLFYADRMVYIFETGTSLIEIPRLPVRLDTDLLARHAALLLRLAALDVVSEATLPATACGGLPGTLYDEVNGQVYGLSVWGQLVWNQVRRNLLGERLINLPRLHYSDAFRKDFAKATPSLRVALQETLATVSLLLDHYQGDTAALKRHPGILYDVYTGKHDRGRPIGHFRLLRDQNAERVSALAEDRGLTLRRFGAHDDVNDNP